MTKPTPKDRLFSKEHEWVKLEGHDAVLGISDHAQCSLGDVVYVELPGVGETVSQGKAVGVVESVKAVSDVFAPVSGIVKAVNQTVIDHPELINQDPYGDGWLLVIEVKDSREQQALLNADQYQELLTQEAK